MAHIKETVICDLCKNPYSRFRSSSHGPRRQICRCCNGKTQVKLLHGEGPLSPTWKGGHEHWQEGKLGRDKDGLSWKIQRELCRERDNHTCQDCGKHASELGYEPHCDHESPYRTSRSHALSNLKLRCRSCHKKIEATRTELWDGKTFGGSVGRKPTPLCILCNKKRRLENGKCRSCVMEKEIMPRLIELRKKGLSLEDLADVFKTSNQLISYWLKTYSGGATG